jgi:hypothetical protein
MKVSENAQAALADTNARLNDIGLTIIESGFTGVRAILLKTGHLLWQCRIDTPEGILFSFICCDALKGRRLPSPEQVLRILFPLLESNDGGHA